MDTTAKQASYVIDSVAKAVANWTVDEHARLNPQMPERYGASWRADWIGHTLAQLHMLAQAVAVRSPVLFANSVRWTHESFEARGITEADLKQNARGKVVKITEEVSGNRDTIMVPAEILGDFIEALTDIRATADGEDVE